MTARFALAFALILLTAAAPRHHSSTPPPIPLADTVRVAMVTELGEIDLERAAQNANHLPALILCYRIAICQKPVPTFWRDALKGEMLDKPVHILSVRPVPVPHASLAQPISASAPVRQ